MVLRLVLLCDDTTQFRDETVVIVGEFGQLVSEINFTIGHLGFRTHEIHHEIAVVSRVHINHEQRILTILDL